MSIPKPIQSIPQISGTDNRLRQPQNINLPFLNYDTNTYTVTVPSVTLPENALRLYKVLFISAIEGKLREIVESIKDAVVYTINKYKYDLALIEDKYDKLLRRNLNKYGSLTSGVVSGSLLESSESIQISEDNEKLELTIKTIDRLIETFISASVITIGKYTEATSLYQKIVVDDFKLTSKVVTDWIDYLNVEYSRIIAENELKLAQLKNNIEAFNVNIDRLLHDLDKEYAKILDIRLNNELRSAINTYKTIELEHLLELKRYGLLAGHLVEIQAREYEALLKKTASEIDFIRTTAKIVDEYVNLHRTKVSLEESKLAVTNEKLEALQIAIGNISDKVSTAEEVAESRYRLGTSQIQEIKNKINIQRRKLLDTDLEYYEELNHLITEIREKQAEYLNKRNEVLDNIISELEVEKNAGIEEARARHYFNYILESYQNKVSILERSINTITHAIADWYRTCAVTSANITASFIRSYS